MFLVDTSVWISILRDRTDSIRQVFQTLVGDEDILLSRFSQMELLQGCRDEREWMLLQTYLQDQDYIELAEHSWLAAARIYYDLRRHGLTVRSSIDCCIAQLAIENQLTLIHNDRDFNTIQRVRSLVCLHFQPSNQQ
jgi:predicted nucleic acid-binding protein